MTWRSWSALELSAAFAGRRQRPRRRRPRVLPKSQRVQAERAHRGARPASDERGRLRRVAAAGDQLPAGRPADPGAGAARRARGRSAGVVGAPHLAVARFPLRGAHAFSFQFTSEADASKAMRFTATAHGDLDGDGVLSTFEVRGERIPGEPARVLPGMFVDRRWNDGGPSRARGGASSASSGSPLAPRPPRRRARGARRRRALRRRRRRHRERARAGRGPGAAGRRDLRRVRAAADGRGGPPVSSATAPRWPICSGRTCSSRRACTPWSGAGSRTSPCCSTPSTRSTRPSASPTCSRTRSSRSR